MSTSGKMCPFKQLCQYNRITQASTLFSPVTHIQTHNLQLQQIISSPIIDSQLCLLMEMKMIISSSVLSSCLLAESDFCVVLWLYTWTVTPLTRHIHSSPQTILFFLSFFLQWTKNIRWDKNDSWAAVWFWYLIQSHVEQQLLKTSNYVYSSLINTFINLKTCMNVHISYNR